MKLHPLTKTQSMRQAWRQTAGFHPNIGHPLLNGGNLVLRTTWIALLAITLLASCNRSEEHGFRSSEEAINAYTSFFQKVKNTGNVTTDKLVELAQEWYALDDSVINCISRDSMTAHTPVGYEIIKDSLRSRMGKLVDKRRWTLTDYLTVIEKLERVEIDTTSLLLADSIHRFYSGLDSVQTYGVNATRTIHLYQKMLDNTLEAGLHSRADIFDFLRKEDAAFRSFLEHLSAYGNIPLDDITLQTGKVIRHIIDLSMKEPPLFGKEKLVILLTVRNNRRLLQNAVACLDEIQHKRMTDSNRSTAYLWMLIQPWISFDELSYALLSEEQMRALHRLAKETSKAANSLKLSGFPLEVDELPALLVKAYITNIN